MDLASVLQALQSSDLAHAVKRAPGVYPIVNTAHVLGLALAIGSLVALDLRLLGAARDIPIAAAERYLRQLAIAGLAIAAASGLLLFAAEAVTLSANRVFLAKMALLIAALANAAVFVLVWGKQTGTWVTSVPAAAQMQAALSLLLWIGIVVAGRLIAYY
jgi:hypothetical protein